MTQRYAYISIIICLAALASSARLEAQERQPYSLDQIVQLVESGVFSTGRIMMLVNESCIGFRVDDAAASRLRSAGADEGLIASLERACLRLPLVVETVVVTPAELDVSVGVTGILRARALSPDSTLLTGVVFEWISGDTAIADVSGGGTVLGKAPGEVQITAATEEGPCGTALVRVGGGAVAEDVEGAPAEAAVGGKRTGTAAALGVVVPGGGVMYSGNTAKGVAIFGGAIAALAAGYFITSEELQNVSYDARTTGNCAVGGTPCSYDVIRTGEYKETNNIVIGAAVAGALWVYGLVDGVRAAKKTQTVPAQEQLGENAGMSLEVAPVDGIRYTAHGDVELTLIRIRS
jgi:hypothetical protein